MIAERNVGLLPSLATTLNPVTNFPIVLPETTGRITKFVIKIKKATSQPIESEGSRHNFTPLKPLDAAIRNVTAGAAIKIR